LLPLLLTIAGWAPDHR